MRAVKKRNIAVAIILSLVTCGIYSWYWLYSLAEDIKTVAQRPEGTSGGLVLVFSILTCGIYTLYWFYKSGETLEQLRAEQGRSKGYLQIVYLVLAVCSLGIVAYALMQSELNEYAEE